MRQVAFWCFLVFFTASAWATGVHKDDIRYQSLVDRLTPTFETVVRGLTLGKNEFDQLSAIAQGKTGGGDPTALCQQLFADELSTEATYCNTGQPGQTKTDDLSGAGACLNRLYNQATGTTVTPTDDDCFDKLYRFIEVR